MKLRSQLSLCRFAIFCGVVLLLTTASFSREVVTDYDHYADFNHYKTYSWAKVETPDTLWDQRVKDAIDKELSDKGWTQVADGGDVSIVAVGTTRERQNLETFYTGMGWRWRGFGDAVTEVHPYRVGSLIVDMFDTSNKKLIWRGSASDVLSNKPDKNIRELEKDVHKMFEHFPPSR
jgi:hypothetical protein